jgi:hypothetical protein
VLGSSSRGEVRCVGGYRAMEAADGGVDWVVERACGRQL